LIVPNLEALQQWADAQNLYQTGRGRGAEENKDATKKLTLRVIVQNFRQELNREVQNRPGYRANDRLVPLN